jgi:hypothetical protein
MLACKMGHFWMCPLAQEDVSISKMDILQTVTPMFAPMENASCRAVCCLGLFVLVLGPVSVMSAQVDTGRAPRGGVPRQAEDVVRRQPPEAGPEASGIARSRPRNRSSFPAAGAERSHKSQVSIHLSSWSLVLRRAATKALNALHRSHSIGHGICQSR